MSVSDILFAFVALVAAACFAGLVTLQAMEWKYYEENTAGMGGNVWARTAAARPPA